MNSILFACWSMGHPCSIQRGLARRLCILLVCTDPLSALAPKLQEVYGPLRFGPRLGGGGHSAWCTRLAKELDRPPHCAPRWGVSGGSFFSCMSYLGGDGGSGRRH